MDSVVTMGGRTTPRGFIRRWTTSATATSRDVDEENGAQAVTADEPAGDGAERHRRQRRARQHPNPVARISSGITSPAVVYAAVIAVPTATPKIVAADDERGGERQAIISSTPNGRRHRPAGDGRAQPQWRASSGPPWWWPDRRRHGHHREEHAGDDGHLCAERPSAGHVQRQDRREAAVDELHRKDDDHQHARSARRPSPSGRCDAMAAVRGRRLSRSPARLAIEHHDQSRGRRRRTPRTRERRAAARGSVRARPRSTGPSAGPETLRRLHRGEGRSEAAGLARTAPPSRAPARRSPAKNPWRARSAKTCQGLVT